MNETKTELKPAIILATIAGVEGVWVALNFFRNGQKFLTYLGFNFSPDARSGTFLGWILALIVTILFVWQAARLPSVRANLLRPSWLKLLALAVAVFAGILEEAVFRKMLMDYLSATGFGQILQILMSGLAFGLAHGVWGLFGRNLRAALGAVIATGFLGALLAIVYIASDRILAPCIAAHFLINLLLEPGLVLAATRGEMNNRNYQTN